MRGIGDFLYEYLAVVNDGKQQSLKQARPERGAPFFCRTGELRRRENLPPRKCDCAALRVRRVRFKKKFSPFQKFLYTTS